MLIVACAALLVAGAGLLGLVTGNAGQPVANGPAVLIAAGDIADCNEDGDSATATLAPRGACNAKARLTATVTRADAGVGATDGSS